MASFGLLREVVAGKRDRRGVGPLRWIDGVPPEPGGKASTGICRDVEVIGVRDLLQGIPGTGGGFPDVRFGLENRRVIDAAERSAVAGWCVALRED